MVHALCVGDVLCECLRDISSKSTVVYASLCDIHYKIQIWASGQGTSWKYMCMALYARNLIGMPMCAIVYGAMMETW